MKRVLSLLLCIALTLSLTACDIFFIANRQKAAEKQEEDSATATLPEGWNGSYIINGENGSVEYWSGITGGQVNPDGSITVTIPGEGDVTVEEDGSFEGGNDTEDGTQTAPNPNAPDSGQSDNTQNDGHKHNWEKANCMRPKTCTLCGATSGSKTGHSGGKAACHEKAFCDYCGQQYGSYADHTWNAATCQEPKNCKYCGATEGTAKAHSYSAATCTEPKTCKECYATEGDSLGHSYSGGSCSRCGKTDSRVKVIGSLPTIMDFGQITKASAFIQGSTIYLKLEGTKTGSDSSGRVHWYLFGDGYKDAGDGHVTISGVSGKFIKLFPIATTSSQYSSYSITLMDGY